MRAMTRPMIIRQPDSGTSSVSFISHLFCLSAIATTIVNRKRMRSREWVMESLERVWGNTFQRMSYPGSSVGFFFVRNPGQ